MIIVIGNRELHQVGLDKAVYLAIHHGIHVVCLETCTVIFHPAVIKNVAAYLTSPLYLLLSCLNLCLLCLTLFQSTIIELTLKQKHSLGTVLWLITSFCILNKNLFMLTCIRIFILVTKTNTRLYLVNILTTCT